MIWKYKKCYQEDSEDVIIDPPPSTDLRITSSVPKSGTGVIDIMGGEPNEIINLYNEFTHFNSSTFYTTPLGACSPPLDSLHRYSTGVITLNAMGVISYDYGISDDTNVRITITGRSSSEPMPLPSNKFTVVSNT